MANTEHDRCRNCYYWTMGLEEKGSCSKHNQDTKLKGWCGDHMREDPLDLNDPAVIMDHIATRGILEAQGKELRPWDGDIYQQFRDAVKAYGY